MAPYLYGDEIAELQNFKPVNMPYSAGYACGYYLKRELSTVRMSVSSG